MAIVLAVTLKVGAAAIKGSASGGSKGASPAGGSVDSKIDDAKVIAEVDGLEIRAVIATATLTETYNDPTVSGTILPGETLIAIIGLGFEESRSDEAEVSLQMNPDYAGNEGQTFPIIEPKNND